MRGLAASARIQGQYKAAIKHLERVLEISQEFKEFTGGGACARGARGAEGACGTSLRLTAAHPGMRAQAMRTRTAPLRTATRTWETSTRQLLTTTSTSRR